MKLVVHKKNIVLGKNLKVHLFVEGGSVLLGCHVKHPIYIYEVYTLLFYVVKMATHYKQEVDNISPVDNSFCKKNMRNPYECWNILIFFFSQFGVLVELASTYSLCIKM